MHLTFNSIEAFTCLKCLNALLNGDPNKKNKQWKKEAIKFTYAVDTLKPVWRSCPICQLCSCNDRRLQVYSNLLILIVKLKHSNLLPLLSLPFPKDMHIRLSLWVAISLETPMLTSPILLWNSWENTWWRIKDEVLAPL